MKYTKAQIAEFAKMGYHIDENGSLTKEVRVQKVTAARNAESVKPEPKKVVKPKAKKTTAPRKPRTPKGSKILPGENQVHVSLSRGKGQGFYPETDKDFTEIQEGKLPWNVLDIIINESMSKDYGMHRGRIHEMALYRQPELATDEWGESKSVDTLLKDFMRGGLIKDNYGKYAITKTGEQFFKYNTISK